MAEAREFVVKLVTEGFVRRVKAQQMEVGKDDYGFTNRVPGSPTQWETVAAFPRSQVEYAIEASQWVDEEN